MVKNLESSLEGVFKEMIVWPRGGRNPGDLRLTFQYLRGCMFQIFVSTWIWQWMLRTEIPSIETDMPFWRIAWSAVPRPLKKSLGSLRLIRHKLFLKSVGLCQSVLTVNIYLSGL